MCSICHNRFNQETGCAQTPEPPGKIQNLQVLIQTPEPPGKTQDLRTLAANSLNNQHRQELAQN
jgi:hypothetical protein